MSTLSLPSQLIFAASSQFDALLRRKNRSRLSFDEPAPSHYRGIYLPGSDCTQPAASSSTQALGAETGKHMCRR